MPPAGCYRLAMLHRCLTFAGLGLAGVLLVARPSAAQTDDAVWAGWRWAPPAPGSRAGGFGGSFVAIADGVTATQLNPAGITSIPEWEVNLSSNPRWLAAGRDLRHVWLAGYLTRTEEIGQPPGETSPRFQESHAWEAGLGLAARPTTRLRVGVAFAWTHLDLESQPSEAAVTADDAHLRVTAGALITLMGARSPSLPSLRLGLSYQPGFDWTAQMAGGRAGRDVPASIALRRPTVVSAGLAFRPADRWTLTAQGDLIRYREVVTSLRANVGDRADGFLLPDAIEPRIGVEFTAPLWCGCGIVRVRGGLQYVSPGTLRYEGADPTTRQAFTPTHYRTVVGLGASFSSEHFGNALRLDIDSRDLVEGPQLSFGIVWRF
jgi:hypothetical protein